MTVRPAGAASADPKRRYRLLMVGAPLLACVLAPAAAAGQAADRALAAEQARRATDRIHALQREADELASEGRGLLVELRQLEIDRRLHAEELIRVEAELTLVTARLEETQARVEALERQALHERMGVEARLVEMYKLGRAGYVRMLLSVENLRALGRAFRTVSALHRRDRERVEAHRRTLGALEEERRALESRASEIADLRSRARTARDELDRAVGERQALVRAIDARRDLTAQLAGELSVAQQRLQASLTTLAAGGVVDRAQFALPIAPFRGALDWPVQGRLTSRFGRVVASEGGAAVRQGIEVVAEQGAIVRAVHEGRVAFAGPFTGFGNLVILDHGGGSFSLYGHLDATGVAADAHMERGTPLGTVGLGPTGGASTLYFELRIDGAPVDPVQWLRRQ